MKGFYWYFRPIALSAKVFGVLPLQNLHYSDGSKIYFRYLSISHLYSTVVFIAVLSLFGYYSRFEFGDPVSSASEYWKILVVYVMLLRSCLCFIFCVHHSKKIPNLIKTLEVFERKKFQMLNKKEHICKKFFTRCILPFLNGTFYVTISYYEVRAFIRPLLAEDIRNNVRGNIAATIFGILGDWQVVPLLLYLYFASIIKHNFLEINESLASYTQIDNMGKENFQCDPNLSKILQNSRCMHTLISTAVTELSNCYGSFMAVDQLCVNIMFVINIFVYFFISHVNDFHLMMCTVISGMLVLAVIMFSHAVKDSAIEILDSLQKVSLSEIDDKSHREVQLFMNQLSARPIEISAAGYFTMDRTQIPSMFSSVATYFIVILQFNSFSGDSPTKI